jgi:hypothetical protein
MSSRMDSIISKVKEVLLNDPEVKAKWYQFTTIKSISDLLTAAKSLFWLAQRIVFLLEYVQKEIGAMTKDERIEAAALLLDDLIVFKGWASVFELFDYMVFKLLISQAVAALDDKFGKDWLTNNVVANELDKAGNLISKANEVFKLLNE